MAVIFHQARYLVQVWRGLQGSAGLRVAQVLAVVEDARCSKAAGARRPSLLVQLAPVLFALLRASLVG